MLTAFWTGGGREWAMQVTKADYDMMMMMIQGLENELYWLRTAAVEQAHQNGPLPVDAGSPTMARSSRPRIRTLSLLQHSFRLCRSSKQSDQWMRGTLAHQFFYKHAYCRPLQAFDNDERRFRSKRKSHHRFRKDGNVNFQVQILQSNQYTAYGSNASTDRATKRCYRQDIISAKHLFKRSG